MSLSVKTNLEEYARQCTLERRHYAACMQQQNILAEAATLQAETTAQAVLTKPPSEGNQFDQCREQSAHSSLMDLLETPLEPLAWEDDNLSSEPYAQTLNEGHQWQDCGSQTSPQSVNTLSKGVSTVGYGAP